MAHHNTRGDICGRKLGHTGNHFCSASPGGYPIQTECEYCVYYDGAGNGQYSLEFLFGGWAPCQCGHHPASHIIRHPHVCATEEHVFRRGYAQEMCHCKGYTPRVIVFEDIIEICKDMDKIMEQHQ